jgi:hypothetical protein
MQKCPKIGDRVRTGADYWTGPFTGTVTAIYPKHSYLVEDDDPRWDDPDFVPPRGPLLPESRWQVGVQVDAIPAHWPYPGSDKIAPDVSELFPA